MEVNGSKEERKRRLRKNIIIKKKKKIELGWTLKINCFCFVNILLKKKKWYYNWKKKLKYVDNYIIDDLCVEIQYKVKGRKKN